MSKFKVGDTVKLISSYKRYYDFNYTICSQEFYKVVDLCEDGIKIDGCVYFMPSDHFEIIKENFVNKPTIGKKYQANHSGDNKWYECVVLYNHPENKEAYACMKVGANTLFWSSQFKALETPEQQQLAQVMDKLNQLNAEAEQLQAIINKGRV